MVLVGKPEEVRSWEELLGWKGRQEFAMRLAWMAGVDETDVRELAGRGACGILQHCVLEGSLALTDMEPKS